MTRDDSAAAGFSLLEFKTRDGLTLAAQACGGGTSPWVLLLHGGGQTRHAWAGTMRRLAQAGYRCVAYDARGHGDSDWSPQGDYGAATMAGDLADVVQALGAPALLVGASMGGLAGFCAIGMSERTMARALVMMDVALRPNMAGYERIRGFMLAHQGGFASLDEAADAVAAFNPRRPRPDNPAGLMKNLRQRADGRLYWHWDPRFPPIFYQGREQLLLSVSHRVTVPVLLLRGEHSDVVDAEGVAQLQSRVPHVEVREVKGADHMVSGDKNDAFVDAMLPLLHRVAAPHGSSETEK